MADTLRLAIAQLNTTVGDLDGNVARALEVVAQAEAADADVILLPEMTITGYPPEDLVLKPGFVADTRAALEKFAAGTSRIAAVVGFADGADGDPVVGGLVELRRDDEQPRQRSERAP